MHGMKLLALANLVNLSQSAIATHLGINRVQVHRWACGERQIPQRFLSPLTDLVFQAAKHSVAQLAPQGSVTLAEIGNSHTREDKRVQITKLLNACICENMKLPETDPTAAVTSTLIALEAFQGMSPADMRKPTNAQRLVTLATHLLTYGQMVSRLEPLLDLASEEDSIVNNGGKLAEPGAAGPANASNQ